MVHLFTSHSLLLSELQHDDRSLLDVLDNALFFFGCTRESVAEHEQKSPEGAIVATAVTTALAEGRAAFRKVLIPGERTERPAEAELWRTLGVLLSLQGLKPPFWEKGIQHLECTPTAIQEVLANAHNLQVH